MRYSTPEFLFAIYHFILQACKESFKCLITFLGSLIYSRTFQNLYKHLTELVL